MREPTTVKCGCGAKITKSLSFPLSEFMDRHVGCSRAWQKCPVCDGRGWVHESWLSGIPTTTTCMCPTCKGDGIIERDPKPTVEVREIPGLARVE